MRSSRSAVPVSGGRTETADDAIRHILSLDDVQLPVLPESATLLLKQTNDMDCDPGEVVTLIKRDQSLTSHLLRIANSVRYNFGTHTVSSVQQAVARLGLLKIREIVVVMCCQCRIFDAPGFEADVRQSFRVSLATAVYAQEIARVRRLNVEDAFLSGLLHDVGRPVLLQTLTDRRATSGLQATDDDLRVAAENHRIPLAARMVESWELPSRISDAIRHQLTPLETLDQNPGSAILNLAIDLARRTLTPASKVPDGPFLHPMISVLNLYPEQVREILRNHNDILDWVNASS